MTGLRELIEAVERDEWSAAGDGSDTWLRIFDAGLRDYHQLIFQAWRQNDLNAARALHEAVLPGWHVNRIVGPDASGKWRVALKETRVRGPLRAAVNDNPARAWLLSILKALEAQQ